jgi:S-methylmethionine-dependent homocysteine/selenocysteine methylase
MRQAAAFYAYTTFVYRSNHRLLTMASTSRADEVFHELLVHQPDPTNKSEKQHSSRILLLDGGTGEELFRQGMPDDRKIWSAAAVVNPQYHSILKKVHQSFVDAGSQGITTNSYGIVPGVGFTEDEIAKYVAEAGRLARESVRTSASSSTPTASALVFGSLGPLKESYRPDLILPHEEGVRIYSIMIAALKPNVDCFLAETMSSYEESIQAVEAVATTCMPMLVSYTLNSRGALRSGESVGDAIHKLLVFAKQRGTRVRGVLFNCSEPEAISIALKELHDNSFRSNEEGRLLLLGAYANRLTPIVDDAWTMAESDGPQPMRKDLTPHVYCTKFVSKWVDEYDAQLIGGCCGIEPAHIDYLSKHFSVSKTK